MVENFYLLKVIKTRKPHQCIVCKQTIPEGTRVLVETGCNLEDDCFSSFCCIPDCVDVFLRESFSVDKELLHELQLRRHIIDPTFFGELLYFRWIGKNE